MEKLDHPLVFLIAVTLGVVGVMALGSWGFTALGWEGPAKLLRGPSAL